MDEKKEIVDLVVKNFQSKSGKVSKGASDCSCSGCSCPGGSVGSVSAEVIGYSGGYAGDLSTKI